MLRKMFFLIFALIATAASAQNIVYDQTNQNGVRTVVCSGLNARVSNSIDAYIYKLSALSFSAFSATVKASIIS